MTPSGPTVIRLLLETNVCIAVHNGQIRAELERRRTSIGPLDLLIAGHARSLQATVVTGNEREFRRVPGLRVENWLTE